MTAVYHLPAEISVLIPACVATDRFVERKAIFIFT